MIRDCGLCRCCGFKASHVHHIVPLVFTQDDTAKNMLALCDTCHWYAPNTKDEFIDYMNLGGAKTMMYLGMIVRKMEDNNIDFSMAKSIIKGLFNTLKNLDRRDMLEKYGKESLELEIDDCDLNKTVNNEQPSDGEAETIQDFLLGLIANFDKIDSTRRRDRVLKAFQNKTGGWGRKPLNDRVIKEVLELHSNNKSMREIRNLVHYTDKNKNERNLSLGAVHKIINTHRSPLEGVKELISTDIELNEEKPVERLETSFFETMRW
jgi:hypothetical protein